MTVDSPDLRDALDHAYRFLSFRARSALEIRDYLLRKGYSASLVESALGRLEEYGYINDLEFARQFVASKDDWGSERLKFELRRKGIDPAIIDKVMLSKSEERDRCVRVASEYLAKRGSKSDWAARRKLWAYLVRRGFSLDSVEAAMRWASESFDE